MTSGCPYPPEPLTANQRKYLEEFFGMPFEQLEQESKREWDRDVEIGIKTGHLSRRADGAIVGKGDPNDWFDAVEDYRKNM